jgi:hypothetical protein
MKLFLILVLTLTGFMASGPAFASKIQQQGIKTATDCTNAGASLANCLPLDSQIWASSVTPAQTLASAISTGVIGGGAGGSKNYLSNYNGNTGNGNFEQGTTNGFSLFNTTLTSGVPTGTITTGATSLTTFAATTSSPLAGTASLNVGSSSTVTAGQGFISSAFTIDSEDKAKVLTIKAYYQVQAGAANLNFSGTSSNTFAVYVYDVTNSAWIQPAGVYGMTQNSGAGYVTATFQTTSNSTQYRLAILAINASTGTAFNIYFDDLSVGPQTAPLGVPSSDTKSYTPVFVGMTPTSVSVESRRNGDSLEITGNFTPATLTSSSVTMTLGFAGISGNVTVATSLPNVQVVGGGGSQRVQPDVVQVMAAPGNNYVTFAIANGTVGGYTNTVGTNFPSVPISFYAKIPIQGWSSNVQSSADTDTRVLAAKLNTLSSTSVAANAAITFANLEADTHGAVSSLNKFSAPTSGFYQISYFLDTTSSGSAGIYIAKNGSFTATASNKIGSISPSQGTGGSIILQLSAGDYIQLASNAAYTASSTNANFSVARLSGPSVVTATESVSMRYHSATATLSATASPVTYTVKDFDSHGAYSGSTYTCPVSGKYQVNAEVYISATGTFGVSIGIYKNGTMYDNFIPGLAQASGVSLGWIVSDIVPCNAGDTLQIYATAGGTSPTITASTTSNWVSISRVGN